MAAAMQVAFLLLCSLFSLTNSGTLRIKMHSFNRPLGKTVEEVEKVATKLEKLRKEKIENPERTGEVYDVSQEVSKIKKKIPGNLCQFFKTDQLRFEWCEFETPLKDSFESTRAFLRNVGLRSDAVEGVIFDTRNEVLREPCNLAKPPPTSFDYQIGEVQYKLKKMKEYFQTMREEKSVDDGIEIEEVYALCLEVEKERKELKEKFKNLVDFWRTTTAQKINYLKRFWAYDGEKYIRKHYIFCANYYGLNRGLKECYKIKQIDKKERRLQSKLQSDKPHAHVHGVTRPLGISTVGPVKKSADDIKETDNILR